MIELEGRSLVDAGAGIVARRVFADPAIHALEQERVFRRTWCFLGHESSLADPNCFITTSIGEDPIVVWRDSSGFVHAFLNTCPHRGNTLCLFDSGCAPTFRCSYHGWTFNSEGRLVAVPFQERAYYGDLNKEANGLLEVPRVETYGGLIFGCWDPEAIPLTRHLGELRWWLDVFICSEDLGGLVALAGTQRYRTAGNWKFFCDNFVGDRYHTPTSHASAIKLGLARPSSQQGQDGYFMTFLKPAHGLGGIFTNTDLYERDLAQAEAMGPDITDYVRHRFDLLQRRLRGVESKPSHFSFGLGFPSFLLQGIGGAFRGNLIGVCHPRGLHECEIQQWVLVEREAPDEVKRSAARFVSRGQSGAGLIGVDDTENFDRIDQNMRAPMASRGTLNFGMGVGHEGHWPGQETWRVAGLPGQIGPEFWEVSQRHFYSEWARMMELEST